MNYVFVVMYQEAQYEESTPIRAFQYEETALEFINGEYQLNPKMAGCYSIESIPLQLN